ncbi:DMT family transporter [Candidatus Chlorohelix sp.]|uniref:DMT family transporter n=1 Tax=Candidatus Chlorohelix sp. TaxID=3139201 RepID=UPI00306F6781
MRQLEQMTETAPIQSISFKTKLLTGSGRHWLGIGIVAIAGASYGIQAVLAKYAYEGNANVASLLTIRFIGAGLVIWLTIWILIRRGVRLQIRQPRRKAVSFFLLGLIWITNSLFYYMGLELLPAGTASLLVFVFPALIVLWSVLFFNEKLNWIKTIALGMALLGCFLTVDPSTAFMAGATFSWLGALYIFGSAFSNSWYSVLAQHFGKNTNGLIMAGYCIPITAVCFTIYVSLTDTFRFDMTVEGWVCCIAIGVMTGFSVFLLLMGINIIGATRAGIVATSEPAVTVLLGALLLDESITLAKLLGGFLIALAILSLSRRAPEEISHS